MRFRVRVRVRGLVLGPWARRAPQEKLMRFRERKTHEI
jgi:hypothetical protein